MIGELSPKRLAIIDLNLQVYMATTVSEIQELVKHLPEAKLPKALCLLRELSEHGDSNASKSPFLRLPLAERRRIMAEQAQQMASYYEQNALDRETWQSGEFTNDA